MNTIDSSVKLDIACGKNKKPGFIGVDIWSGADIVFNLESYPWPFVDSSVDEINCSHYIEHVSDLIAFMNELHRIMKPGAKAHLIAPYYSSIRAWQDPTHVRAISEETFNYFNYEWRSNSCLDHYPIIADFDFTLGIDIEQNWKDKSEDELKFAIRHYINVVSDIHIFLTKRTRESAAVMLNNATDRWNNGEFEEAVKLCNHLLTFNECPLEAHMMLAEDAFRRGDYLNAISLFRQVLALDRELLQAHTGLIRSLNKAGSAKESQLHLDGVRRVDPELADLILHVTSIVTEPNNS